MRAGCGAQARWAARQGDPRRGRVWSGMAQPCPAEAPAGEPRSVPTHGAVPCAPCVSGCALSSGTGRSRGAAGRRALSAAPGQARLWPALSSRGSSRPTSRRRPVTVTEHLSPKAGDSRQFVPQRTRQLGLAKLKPSEGTIS